MDDANSSGGKKETKRGRAAFMASDDQRATVRRMASERLGHPVIAAEIGISVPTLRKAFAEELKDRLAGGNLFAAAAEEIPAPRPAPPKGKRPGTGGRKRFEPQDRDREKVAVLVSSGLTVEQIATAMALSEPTLRRAFKAELETGAVRKRAEMLVALHKTALKGNVAAQKEALAIMDRANLEALQDHLRGKGKSEAAPSTGSGHSAPPPADALGKKEQANLDAHSVVTHGPWANLVRTPRQA
ncbi:AraC-like DNA-binding protein [Bosea sp. OAE752]|uniref:helix-turn-helix domain-containing protein n=1 Tax=Bosea sp. OAE752 TaxID=2663873 RepID=UPI003D24BCD7